MRISFIYFFAALGLLQINAAVAACDDPANNSRANCPAGCRWMGGTTCADCSNGTWSAGNVTSCSNCTGPAGAIFTTKGTTANNCEWTVTCAAGQYWDGNSCEACKGNTVSENPTTVIGQGANSAPTTCTLCDASKHLVPNSTNSECVCTPGYNKQGNNCVGNSYIINFDVNGGTPQGSKSCSSYGDECVWKNVTTKSGYTLDGWAAVSGGTNSVATDRLAAGFNSPAPPSPNGSTITLYAIWKQCACNGTNGTGKAHINNGSCQCYILCDAQYYMAKKDANNNPVGYSPSTSVTDKNLSCSACPKGYYCPGADLGNPGSPPQSSKCELVLGSTNYDGRCKCPLGATTNATGNSSISDCAIVGGSTGTRFCDSYGCFNFPAGIAIKYKN
jgi:hypothetical protein